MKTLITASAALLIGLAIGGGVATLHAQGSKPVYMVSEIDVKDADKYASEYAGKMRELIGKHGGKLIVIAGVAGGGAKPITAIDGTAPKRFTIQTWESMDALKKWYDSAERKDLQKIGEQHATIRRFAAEAQ